MTRMLSDPDEQARRYTLGPVRAVHGRARVGPSSGRSSTELQTAAVKSATLIFEAAGLHPRRPQQMDELSRLLNGYVFSQPHDFGRAPTTPAAAGRPGPLRAFFGA